jgi:hypothetical protein
VTKYLHYLNRQEYKIWCLAVVFIKESADAKLIHKSATAMLYMLEIPSSFTGQRKLENWESSLGGGLDVVSGQKLASMVEVMLMKGRKATETGFTVAGMTLTDGLRAHRISCAD